MRSRPLLALLLALSYATPALAAQTAAPASMLSRFSERAEAKREFKQFLRDHGDSKVYPRAKIGLKTFALKGLSISSAVTGTMVALGTLISDAMTSGVAHSFQSEGLLGLVAGGAITVGAWRGAQAVRRHANTRMVLHALKAGAQISAGQLDRWSRTRIIDVIEIPVAVEGRSSN